MDKKHLQDNILSQPYNQAVWQDVLRQVFGVKNLFVLPQNIILSDNAIALSAYELGNFSTVDDRLVGVYEITLKDDANTNIAINKVGLRSLLRNVYKYDVDAALVVFVHGDKWRLSFVSEIRALNIENEVITVATEPKRYTYLLGAGEKVNTPAIRLCSLVAGKATLEEILNAFSVETLNEEFYKIVARKFYDLAGVTEGLDKKEIKHERQLTLPSIGENNNILYKEFAVRLIGRTVFCWFLKVKKSEAGLSLLPEHLLSSQAVRKNPNYYHSILEFVFFQTLNTPMENNIRVKNLPHGCEQIPFLNGGLFEPQTEDFYKPDKFTGISQNLNTLVIPDNWFIDFFEELEKYNFTIDENSTVDVEVSVDPEMLGRIFENLLAEIDPDSGDTARKATGSFYTPREIVDYMTTETLEYYLHNKTGIEKTKLEPIFRIDSNVDFTKNENEKLLIALDQLKVLDPACGSGAYPMGVLQKIVMALQKLDKDAVWWKNSQIKRVQNPILRNELREKLSTATVEYARKIGVVQYSLYGVDIQPIAAEISKLRCFLTLIVDENIDETKPNRGIEPLPNLEFKFVTANTLIKLPEEKDFGGLFNFNGDLDDLQQLRLDYMQSFGMHKKAIKEQYLYLQTTLFKKQVTNGIKPDSRAYKISNWNPFNHEKADWFDPLWMFGVTDGFDVVIGNPPYVGISKKNNIEKENLKKQEYDTFENTGDLYALFYEQGNNLLKENGILCYITSNKWINANYGKSSRKYIATKTNPLILIDFAKVKVFKTATVFVNILLFQKAKNDMIMQVCSIDGDKLPKIELRKYFEKNKFILKNLDENVWKVNNANSVRINDNIESKGTKLRDWHDLNFFRGITTGFNRAFYINEVEKNTFISQDPKNTEIIKPFLSGKDIKRWGFKFDNSYMFFIPWHFPLQNDTTITNCSEKAEIQFRIEYPDIYNHLGKYKLELSERNQTETGVRYEWYALQRYGADFWKNFEQPKIVWIEISDKANYAYDESGKFLTNSAYFISGKNLKYILAILNSKVADYYFSQITATIAGGRKRYTKQYVEQIPIPQIPDNEQKPFEKIVDYILFLKQYPDLQDACLACNYFESMLEIMVYELYFEDKIKNAGLNILKYIDEIPFISSFKTVEEQLQNALSIYNYTYNKEHPIRNSIFFIDSIPEVKEIIDFLAK